MRIRINQPHLVFSTKTGWKYKSPRRFAHYFLHGEDDNYYRISKYEASLLPKGKVLTILTTEKL